VEVEAENEYERYNVEDYEPNSEEDFQSLGNDDNPIDDIGLQDRRFG